jgi:hypothetical protein
MCQKIVVCIEKLYLKRIFASMFIQADMSITLLAVSIILYKFVCNIVVLKRLAFFFRKKMFT